ncbi:hypothetical protein K1T71_007438 [Dendrolimus kikuchii]|uniref:Uncharacterized protein n=1 Tax=Dendrolimus kikuchii TaxID=765133 RepID=A0ACC1D132_9NEOP|nr:hypothetical protein K1T71_007438 [Dendrolimus kikuchii]
MWREVANEININERNVRRKWKNMRAYFSRALKKIQHPKSGDGADNIVTSQWTFFEQLKFLKRTVSASERDFNFSITNPPSQSSEPSLNEEPIASITEDFPDIQESLTSGDYNTASAAATSNSSHASRKKRKNYNINSLVEQNHQILELEKRKTTIFEKECNSQPNSDMLVFKSLVSYMANIPMI